jgi:hypothetical protein
VAALLALWELGGMRFPRARNCLICPAFAAVTGVEAGGLVYNFGSKAQHRKLFVAGAASTSL